MNTRALPEADEPLEVLSSMQSVLLLLGQELGERYNVQLRQQIGPLWLEELSRMRGRRINLRDTHFVLAEPLRNADSPTRNCLPRSAAFYNLLEEALHVRHEWMHQDVYPLDLNELERSVHVIHDLATNAELRLGALCAAIRRRIRDIRNGTYPPPGELSAPESSPTVEELLAELQQVREAERVLQQEIAAATDLLDEAAEVGQSKTEMELRLSDVQRQLNEAKAEKENLEFVISGLAGNQVPDERVDVIPGHQWVGKLPPRKVIMMTLHADLFDETTRARVAAEFGPSAQEVITDWKRTVASQATVYLNNLGQAVTYIGGVPIYLGCLGGSAGSQHETSQLAGFVISHVYTLRLNGEIEDRETDIILSDVNPETAERVAARLLAVVPTGGRLRVTMDGTVACFKGGAWTSVARVAADEWFPGHLS